MSKNTQDRIDLRRETKFERHRLKVVTEGSSDIRTRKVRVWDKEKEQEKVVDEPYTLNFTHAVRVGGRVVARASSRRHALKAAHNWIRKHKGRR